MDTTKIIIVNENDEIIGYKPRDSLNRQDIYRVSALWIKNSKGDILLAQRSFSKKHHPGKWGPAAAGTVEDGETYDSNIIKEAEEELGLTGYRFENGPKALVSGNYPYFRQFYTLFLMKRLDSLLLTKKKLQQYDGFLKKNL